MYYNTAFCEFVNAVCLGMDYPGNWFGQAGNPWLFRKNLPVGSERVWECPHPHARNYCRCAVNNAVYLPGAFGTGRRLPVNRGFFDIAWLPPIASGNDIIAITDFGDTMP